jgi:dihydroxy-acid dehydratase
MPKKKENRMAKREVRDKLFRDYWHSVFLKAMGFCEKEIASTRIAVVNSWSEQSPGHIHLRDLGDAVKAGIRLAGAMPFEVNVLGPCSGLAENEHDVSYYDLPQREVILNSIETAIKVGYCQGWIGLCTCDKIVPAMLIAAIRLNKPCLIVTGGPMIPGKYQDDWLAIGKGFTIAYPKFKAGTLKEEELRAMTCAAGNCAGSCAEMTTGNSMQIMAESLGLAMPGTSMIPAAVAYKKMMAKEAGMQIVKLALDQVTPSQIVTEEAMRNAIAVDMAVGGGTNSLLHLQALAWEAKKNITLDTWAEYSRKIPTICAIAPNGPFSLIDFHEAGGVPAVMNEIRNHLDLNVLTASGKTLKENIKGCKSLNRDVIRPLSDPLSKEGSIAILKGNLAPRGAVIRHTVVTNKKLLKKTYRAKVFDSYEEAVDAIFTDKPKSIQAGDAIVCRYEGPRGGPAMAEVLMVIHSLIAAGKKDVAVITDGRFSGLTRDFPAIGHVCPEAQVGGPIAIVRDGDLISLDLPRRRLELKVDEKEMKKRFERWKPPQKNVSGILTVYRRLALQADNGACWETTAPDVPGDRKSA